MHSRSFENKLQFTYLRVYAFVVSLCDSWIRLLESQSTESLWFIHQRSKSFVVVACSNGYVRHIIRLFDQLRLPD
jgi:hypothetical protein